MTQTEEKNYLRHIINIDTSLQSIAKSLKQIAENTKPIPCTKEEIETEVME